jgi:hypothetical protein
VCEILYQKLAMARKEEEMAREKPFGRGALTILEFRLHDVTAAATHLHVKVSLQ